MRALFVTVRMKPEYRDQILKGALEDGRGSREDEPGCLRFDVIQDDSDPNTIYFYEVYRDDAALQAHRASPHYPAWGNLPAEWFVGQKAVVVRGTMIAPSEASTARYWLRARSLGRCQARSAPLFYAPGEQRRDGLFVG